MTWGDAQEQEYLNGCPLEHNYMLRLSALPKQ